MFLFFFIVLSLCALPQILLISLVVRIDRPITCGEKSPPQVRRGCRQEEESSEEEERTPTKNLVMQWPVSSIRRSGGHAGDVMGTEKHNIEKQYINLRGGE